MKVVIVGKTKKRSTACVGAIAIDSGMPLRLFDSDGDDPPMDTDYEVGEIWDIEFVRSQDMDPPFREDVLVSESECVENMDEEEIRSFLLNNAPIWHGRPAALFEGTVHFRNSGTGEIRRDNVPTASTGFWLPDQELTLIDDTYPGNPKKLSYTYGHGEQYAKFPYKGFPDPVELIAAGTLLRMSLSRWWPPEDEACFLQLSGCFI